MDCRTVRGQLSDYLDGLLNPAQRSEVERHFERCGRCHGELRSLEEMIRSLHTMEPPTDPDLLPGIHRKLKHGPWWSHAFKRLSSWPVSLPAYRLAVSMAVLLVVAVISVPLVLRRRASLYEPARLALRSSETAALEKQSAKRFARSKNDMAGGVGQTAIAGSQEKDKSVAPPLVADRVAHRQFARIDNAVPINAQVRGAPKTPEREAGGGALQTVSPAAEPTPERLIASLSESPSSEGRRGNTEGVMAVDGGIQVEKGSARSSAPSSAVDRLAKRKVARVDHALSIHDQVIGVSQGGERTADENDSMRSNEEAGGAGGALSATSTEPSSPSDSASSLYKLGWTGMVVTRSEETAEPKKEPTVLPALSSAPEIATTPLQARWSVRDLAESESRVREWVRLHSGVVPASRGQQLIVQLPHAYVQEFLSLFSSGGRGDVAPFINGLGSELGTLGSGQNDTSRQGPSLGSEPTALNLKPEEMASSAPSDSSSSAAQADLVTIRLELVLAQ